MCSANECGRAFKRKHDLDKHAAAFHQSPVPNVRSATEINGGCPPPVGVSDVFGCPAPHCSARFDSRAACAEHFVTAHAPRSNKPATASTNTPATASTTRVVAPIAAIIACSPLSADLAAETRPCAQAELVLSPAPSQHLAAPNGVEERKKRIHFDHGTDDVADEADAADSDDVEAAALALCCCSEPTDGGGGEGDKRRKREVVKSLSRALLCCKWTKSAEGGVDCHGTHRFQHQHQQHNNVNVVVGDVNLAWKPLEHPLDDTAWWWDSFADDTSVSTSVATNRYPSD